MSIIKQVISIVTTVALAAVGFSIGEPERVTMLLFVHYLGGSGAPVAINAPPHGIGCMPKSTPPGWTGTDVVSVYQTPYQNALGKYSCVYEDGVLVRSFDIYDFSYEGRASICQNLVHPKRWARYIYGGEYPQDQMVANLGRCVVGFGIGKPFDVEVKVK